MGDFEYFLKEGLQHIVDINGYDHILFIVVLCSAYHIKQWKHIFILVTAFTLGHSVTLALAVYKVITLPSSLVELCIASTILGTCVYNLFFKVGKSKISINYILAVFFGLIHGLGFSNYLRSIMAGIGDLTVPLLSFNIGIELGQLQIVLQFIGLVYVLLAIGLKFSLLKHLINGIGILVVVPMIIERL